MLKRFISIKLKVINMKCYECEQGDLNKTNSTCLLTGGGIRKRQEPP